MPASGRSQCPTSVTRVIRDLQDSRGAEISDIEARPAAWERLCGWHDRLTSDSGHRSFWLSTRQFTFDWQKLHRRPLANDAATSCIPVSAIWTPMQSRRNAVKRVNTRDRPLPSSETIRSAEA